MRKLSWIGSLGRYSYLMLVCCGRMAASALLPRKPARGCNWSRVFFADETNRAIRHRVRSKTK
jgi:hypothetical protein